MSVHRRQCGQHEKQQRIRSSVQSEIEETMDQHGETPAETRERNSAPDTIARSGALQSFIKKQRDENQRQRATGDARI